MATKKTHFGRAGEFAALSEFLFRGYNVAIPSVDVGDDAFVINDADGTTWRVQVKTAELEGTAKVKEAVYQLSRAQLLTPKPTELYFMLMARWEGRWHYLLISRAALQEIRRAFEKAPRSARPGRRPLPDDHAKSDQLMLKVTWDGEEPRGWDRSLTDYYDRWPSDLPEVTTGPGATNRSASPSRGRRKRSARPG